MLVPQVVGFRLSGSLPRGRDRDRPRPHGDRDPARRSASSGSSSSTSGPASSGLPVADRATIANMSPEYGATCGFFPVDEETLRYLRLTGPARTSRWSSSRRTAAEQGLFHEPDDTPTYTQIVELDLDDVEPSLAGPAPAAGSRAARPERRTRSTTRSRASGSSTRTARTTRRSPTRSPRATRPPTPRPGTSRTTRRLRAPVAVAEPPAPATVKVTLDERADVRARARRGRDRRDHELHEHLEPDRDGRAPASLAKKAVERGLAAQAVGEVEPRAGLQGRDASTTSAPDSSVPRRARLPHRRLRLHDLHRELGPAAGADLEGDRWTAISSSRRPLRATGTSRRGSIRR